jgi:acetate---CoA ligase (ADP-forming)
VVAKILSPDILHKTDAGGVVLNIEDAEALAAAARDILARVRASHPDASIQGVLVQRMEKGLAELIVGYKRDPQVGPVVSSVSAAYSPRSTRTSRCASRR